MNSSADNLQDLARDGREIRFTCTRCGNIGERPAAHLVAKYGATTIGDLERRSRCLAYRDKIRCNAPARITMVPLGNDAPMGMGD